MQVIITMAGKGTRFSDLGFTEPKPIVLVGGKPAIQYLVDEFPSDWKIIFAVGRHFQNTSIEKVLRNIRPHGEIIFCDYSARGPIDTVKAALSKIDLAAQVLVSYCDYSLIWNPEKFFSAVSGYDAAVVTYHGFHPTYFGPNSYCHVKVSGSEIVQLQEKKLFTENIESEMTSVGLYYFKSGELLVEALEQQEIQNLKYKTEFYTSLAIQALISVKPNLKILNYSVDQIIQFGTPSDIERFEFWNHVIVMKKAMSDFKFINIDPKNQPTNFDSCIFEKEKFYWQKVLSPKNA